MKLTKEILPDHFIIASPRNSHYLTETNTFDFVGRNSDILVVTIGDSWTWGADLSLDNNDKFRINNVYGSLVSDKMQADWLNLGQRGSNNFFIAEKAEELGQIVSQLDYKKIYMICTFTEVGRSFNSHHDSYIDYINWFENNHIDNFLYFLNATCVDRIKKVTQEHNIKLIIGTNFVDATGIDKDLLLPMPWFRLLGIDCRILGYAGTSGVAQLQSALEFTNDIVAYKSWIIRLINQSKHIDQVCGSRLLNISHPNATGHNLWANYILEHIL
jgi:hypothetical protein